MFNFKQFVITYILLLFFCFYGLFHNTQNDEEKDEKNEGGTK